ncbi:glycosyltransferase family 2 protein [Leptolyngbya sp. AN03gr2]|uniref:glycosyltransferase family 2 protein n=1 Tax=unclassified Leptolyngbya TaxID=2650499 RepID=UPI003D32353C
MRCPRLSDLPPPPPGKIGFPWTEESQPLPDTLPNGEAWDKISIVTPSYQQGEFIEETIRSILLQGYPNLEYIIIDGGSTDGTVEIIRKYEPFLTDWMSERDRGQSHAINKGWERATGEILHFLNSDDLLLPGALATIAQVFSEDQAIQVVSGVCPVKDVELKEELRIKLPRAFDLAYFLLDREGVGQPATFIRRDVYEKTGGMDERLHYTLDREYWMRICLRCPGVQVAKLEQPLAIFRWQSNCKSAQSEASYCEREQLLNIYFSELELPDHLRSLKREAYLTFYSTAADLCQQTQAKRKAIEFFFKAMYWNPRLIRSTPRFLLKLMK